MLCATHCFCIFLHLVYRGLELYGVSKDEKADRVAVFHYSYIKRGINLVRVFLFFSVITYVQYIVREYFTYNSKSTNVNSYLITWLFYEVIIFYFSILSLIIFLVVSRVKSFITFRERVGFGANMRYTQDFLDYVKDDIHWVQIYLTQLLLCAQAFNFKQSKAEITLSLVIFIGRFIMNGVILYILFFTKKKAVLIPKYVSIYFAISLSLNSVLGFNLIHLIKIKSFFWTPFVVEEVILHGLIFFQFLIDWR